MAEAGYTAVHDAGLDYDAMRALEALERDGDLPIRVYAMLSARDSGLLREWLTRGPDTDAETMLRTRAVKAYYDGAREIRVEDERDVVPSHCAPRVRAVDALRADSFLCPGLVLDGVGRLHLLRASRRVMAAWSP